MIGIRSVLIGRPAGDGMENPHRCRNMDVMHNGMLICHEQTTAKRDGKNRRTNDGFGINAAWL